jgi:protein-S-isoprenylcysteine O-methyltransferase Ste14
MSANWFPKRYADAVQRLRVASGFILLLAFAWFANPTKLSMLIGLPVAILGLALRAWAAGHLAKDQDLAVSGPYAYVRNPLYIGTATVALGIVVAAQSAWLVLIFVLVFVLVYLPAIELEEQHLRDIFPSYESYATHVHRLMPTRKWRQATGNFSWARYRRNEEYKASLGFLIAVVWLAWKCWLRYSVT